MTYFSNIFAPKSVILGMAAAAVISTAAYAQTAAPEQAEPGVSADPTTDSNVETDITTLTCWDIVTLDRDDSIWAMTLLYGYAIGSKNQSVISAQNSQDAIAATLAQCTENPDALALTVMLEKLPEMADNMESED